MQIEQRGEWEGQNTQNKRKFTRLTQTTSLTVGLLKNFTVTCLAVPRLIIIMKLTFTTWVIVRTWMFLDTCFELILVRDVYTSVKVPVLVFFSKSVQGSAHFKIYSCGKNKTCLTSCLFCYHPLCRPQGFSACTLEHHVEKLRWFYLRGEENAQKLLL